MIIISPAKSLNFKDKIPFINFTLPEFIDKSEFLIDKLKQNEQMQLQEILNITPALAKLNVERFKHWQKQHTIDNSRQAIFAYYGEVFKRLKAYTFTKQDIDFAQQHLRIISGLYGILRPLDLIQPYRLEMASKIDFPELKFPDLYAFWNKPVNDFISTEFKNMKHEYLINLASNEYAKLVQMDTKKMITIVFKELKNNTYKIVAINAKSARGAMTSYIVKNRITDKNVENIKLFTDLGYEYAENLSNSNQWIFIR